MYKSAFKNIETDRERWYNTITLRRDNNESVLLTVRLLFRHAWLSPVFLYEFDRVVDVLNADSLAARSYIASKRRKPVEEIGQERRKSKVYV